MVQLAFRQGYAVATFGPQTSFVQALAAIERISAESVDWPHQRLLVDLSRTHTLRRFSDQFFLGVGVATFLRHLKIASVVPEHRITRTSEKAANQAGGHLKVFDKERDALAWLLSEPL